MDLSLTAIEAALAEQAEYVSAGLAGEAKALFERAQAFAEQAKKIEAQGEAAAKAALENRRKALGAILRAHGVEEWDGCIEVLREGGEVKGLRYLAIPSQAPQPSQGPPTSPPPTTT